MGKLLFLPSLIQIIINMKRILPLLALIFVLEMSFANTRRYRCVWNNDPSTTMTVGFEQYDDSPFDPFDDEGDPAFYYDVVNHGQDASMYAFSQAVDRIQDHKGMENNFVRLTGLQPNTRYYFMIVDDQGASSVMFFETSPDVPTQRLSIIAGGDSRDIPVLDDDIGRQNANKLVAKLRAHAVFFGGDMTWGDDVTHPVDADEWPEWMDDWQLTISDDGRMTPIIAARGNHELDNNSIYHFFDTPNPENYYALSLGGNLVRNITLNSEISRLGNQLEWLEDEASTSCAYWKIAQYHKPTRPHESGKDEQDDQANFWSPLFEEHGVQLVLESDAHLCKFTYPILRSDDAGNTEGFIRDDNNGVVYIGEGGWGAELRTVDDAKDWTMTHGTFNQFKWLFIDQNSIEIRTVITDNADAVTPKTDADSRFTMPNNIDLWMPSPSDTGSGVMTYNNGVITLMNPNNVNPFVDLGPDLEIQDFNSTTIDAGAGFDAYSWSTGETTQVITINDFDTYSVTVTLNGCTATDDVIVSELMVNIINLGGPRGELYPFVLSPNPTKGGIVLSVERVGNELPSSINWVLMDIEGKILMKDRMELSVGTTNKTISLTDYSPGIYFIGLEHQGKMSIQKLMLFGE